MRSFCGISEEIAVNLVRLQYSSSPKAHCFSVGGRQKLLVARASELLLSLLVPFKLQGETELEKDQKERGRVVGEIMGKAAAIFICIFIVALDVTAGILGIKAEMEQNKQRHIRLFIFECKEPSHEALRMGIAAATLLMLAHVIATVHGGCICIFSREELAKSPANRQLAAFLSLCSWIILAIGFSLLIIGALANRHNKGSCGLSHHKMLSTGGILCFVHVIFILGFYVTALAISREEEEKVHKAAAGNTQMTGRHGPEHI